MGTQTTLLRNHCLQYDNNFFPVAVGYFLPVMEFTMKKNAFGMPITILPVVVGYFLPVAGFSISNGNSNYAVA